MNRPQASSAGFGGRRESHAGRVLATALLIAIVVAACGGGSTATGADARDATFANPEQGLTVGDVSLETAAADAEGHESAKDAVAASAAMDTGPAPVDGDEVALDTVTGTDTCINVISGDACVEGDVPCDLECMQCLVWECTDGRWVLKRYCLLMCP